MPTEVKQRKKTQQAPKLGGEPAETLPANGKNEPHKAKTEDGDTEGTNKRSAGPDVKTLLCFLSLAACGALSWVVLQQNERFSLIEEKYKSLHGKTSGLLDMEEKIVTVSRKCEGVRLMLEDVGSRRGAAQPQLEGLQQDVGRLKDWASGLTEKRAQLQSSLTALRGAVGQIEERTSAITKDFTNKVSSVRTDVRRMDGLKSELESLLTKLTDLEERAAQAERSMVKRIGDVLTSSMDRVSDLRSAADRNTKAVEQLHRRVPELAAADASISERLRELEGGRARLIRTVTFASDLKPKVAAIKRDFGALEPQLSELTLRIGTLAEDLGHREQEIAELRQTLSNLTAVDGDLSVASQQISEIADIGAT
ncbi:inhibitor of nuclear factor kappa-B kinase-interacting protein isoform X2 [Cololabis saira]|uniref:inhibitor of nuclear factor kappa-B kinase-interacting protein isoform X2 n=1 Tax=Cololabis saira TaxID=129043 RepID=UPI002AD1E813|nr:inhibitor of nuclear factor kappa-B kinase-interacting protein isoform X2 [Cololabis saira]